MDAVYHCLQPNAADTEVPCSTARLRHHIAATACLIAPYSVTPVSFVHYVVNNKTLNKQEYISHDMPVTRPTVFNQTARFRLYRQV